MYLFRNDVSALDKVHWVITLFIRASLIVAGAGAAFDQKWIVVFITALAFALTFLPRLIEQNARVYLPVEFELIIVLFTYATLFLGEVHQYYTRFWWWDIVLHTGSGLALGVVGFILAYLLYKGKKVSASPILITLFSFCFAVAIGAIWEIFEFGMDSAFGTAMQKSGLVDTMWDLIVDSLGALVASALGFLYLKGRHPWFFDRAIAAFIRDNAKLFR